MLLALSALLILTSPTLPQERHGPPQEPVLKVELAELRDLLVERNAVEQGGFKWSKMLPLLERHWARLDQLLFEDKLTTGGDFYIAAFISADPMAKFDASQRAHEMAVTALLLDEPNAPKLVAHTWDTLVAATGRMSRFGTRLTVDFDTGKPKTADNDPNSIATVREILMNTEAAKAKARNSKDNAELTQLRESDQKDREGDMSKPMSHEESLAWMKRDRQRQKRVLEILKSGGAVTAKDLEAAALVLQHGDGPEAFMAAHELCLASLALGEKTADWLVSRSYDRWLQNVGFRQRYATQLSARGLDPVSLGVNDRMRKLGKTLSLAEMQKRGDEWRKKVFESGG